MLFSPGAPSTTAQTHTTSTERTPRTAGLSHFSDFGSLDTAARSIGDDDITCHGTEEGEELDSLDDGLHAFHEPSEYGAPVVHLDQSNNTVLPTHDGLGTFQPDPAIHEHLWQFERQAPRRPRARRRSSVQRRLDALEANEEASQDQERRQRIETWRLEQSKALLEEIERETRRRRRMSMVSAARSSAGGVLHNQEPSAAVKVAPSVTDAQSVSSDESTENLSFWERLTRRVIRDLMGIDEDTLSVIFGESLPGDPIAQDNAMAESATVPSDLSNVAPAGTEPWEVRLLERVAQELGILVHQLSEHPGAFSTYRRAMEVPEYAGRYPSRHLTTVPFNTPTTPSPSSSTRFAPTFPSQQYTPTYSEASLWGIEEEPEEDPLNSFRAQQNPATVTAEELAREKEYWERELDVKMVFNFLVQRFSRRSSIAQSQRSRSTSASPRHRRTSSAASEALSARRAAIIRQNHPLVPRTADRVPTSSSATRDARRKDTLLFRPQLAHITTSALPRQTLRSSSSCASQSTKKSKRSSGSGRHFWDMSGSVGSGSVFAGEV